ncbi:MAG: nucleotidyltransferase family protein [Rhodospirillaceae bacterium]|nr:nucleotidyltransferase family protein [Rhodospirillales bacterium]
MASLADTLTERRDDILASAARHGATQVRVFGSVVRGEDRPDSDVDLLVLPDDTCGLIELIAFQQEMETLLGRRVDVVSERALHPVIRDRVLSEARML